MDIPQWYNRKLWSASKQSIDGKPVRSHSAGYGIRRNVYTPNSMSGNWANYLKVNNLTPPNKDRGFTYRYTLSSKPTKTIVSGPSTSFSSNYINNLSTINCLGKPSLINPPQLLTLQQKPVIIRERYSNFQNESRPIRLQYPSKRIQPQLVEYEHDINFPFPKKIEYVHGNINSDKDQKDSSGMNIQTESETERYSLKSVKSISESVSQSLNITDSIPVPQNTPRFLDNSSQNNYPKKSILKKTVDIIYQPNIFQNNNNNTLILSAPLKPVIPSPMVNKYHEMRKKLQSAPGMKREVRFDMSNNSVIEFSTN